MKIIKLWKSCPCGSYYFWKVVARGNRTVHGFSCIKCQKERIVRK